MAEADALRKENDDLRERYAELRKVTAEQALGDEDGGDLAQTSSFKARRASLLKREEERLDKQVA